MDARGARRLAAAVLLLAFDQARGRRFVGKREERDREQQEARAFLKGRCRCLAWWCELAEVDPEKIRRALLGGP
jgi:hypothetical protein